MAKHLKQIERKIVEAIKSRFAEPDLEIPLALQDRPTQVVFTGLQPRKRPGMAGQASHVAPLMGALGAGPEALPELMPGPSEAAMAAGPQAASGEPQGGGMEDAMALLMDDEQVA